MATGFPLAVVVTFLAVVLCVFFGTFVPAAAVVRVLAGGVATTELSVGWFAGMMEDTDADKAPSLVVLVDSNFLCFALGSP